MKNILRFLGGVALFYFAYKIFLPLTILNFAILLYKGKAGKYFLSSAVNLDRFANYEFRTLFNLILRKKHGYEFGNFEETISSVLGKNQRDGTLSFVGKCLVWILDKLDKDHCKRAISEMPKAN